MNPDNTAAAAAKPPERRDLRLPRPRTPTPAHLRELTIPDGRRLLLDRRSISFLVEAKPEEFAGRQVTIVAFKGPARPCPVVASYGDLRDWWAVPDALPGNV
jgi:hypothetical protein